MASILEITRVEVIAMIHRKAWLTGEIPEFKKYPGRKAYRCPREVLKRWMRNRIMPAQERVLSKRQRG